MSDSSYCNQPNVKDKLDPSDEVQVLAKYRMRGVEASYFLSRLVEESTLSINGNDLTLRTEFADGTSKLSTVTLP